MSNSESQIYLEKIDDTQPQASNSNRDLDQEAQDTNNLKVQDSTDVTEAAGATAMANKEVDTREQSSNGNGFERLMQRMKSDLMYELRNIQHGEKPVTGQGHRDNIQQFMLKHSDAHNKGQNVPTNVDTVEEHRPEAVVVEVQGMVERRPVSSILQSAAFRRQLENVIRGGIVSASRSPGLAATSRQETHRRRQTPPQQERLTDPRFSSERLPETTNEAAFTIPDERPTLVRSDSTDSIDSFSSARSVADDNDESDEDFSDGNLDEAISARVSRDRDLSLPLPRPAPRSVFLNNVAPEAEAQNGSAAGLPWDNMSSIRREALVQEISELLHTRLVSSTLESEFRATLELQTQERVAASGVNGQAVQDFVRSLPGRGIPRNDFHHLGIPSGGAGAIGGQDIDWDNVSVASISTHSVPYVQTNTYLGLEIQSLRAQITEMKSMLKLNFDLQMDIQRSIRQEVAAALNNRKESGCSAAKPSKPVDDTHCLICLDRHSDSVLYQCGHMCVCYFCGRDLVSRGHTCPVCRAPIKDVIRAYRTNAE